MDQPRIILLCSTRFAMPTLQELVFFNQLAVVVIPANAEEMIEHVQAMLKGTSIPVLTVDRNNCEKELIKAIKKYEVNIGLVITFSFLINKSVYTLPAKGFYNFHPGPLPQYRGADPVFQQIKNKEANAGVTIHKLDDRFDTGAVVIKEMIKLEATDTYGILTSKLAQVAAKLCRTLMKMMSLDIDIPGKVQDESHATYYKRQSANDVIINWKEMDAATIVALINACNPWNKGAITKLNNKIIRLVQADKLSFGFFTLAATGTILSISDAGMQVATVNEEAISVNIVYLDEGFITAKQLSAMGLVAGNQFDTQ